MEQTEELSQVKEELVFNDEIKGHLKETAKWGTFLAIMGYISVGLMTLVSLVLLAVRSTLTSFDRTGFLGKHPYFYLIYLVAALIYFFPVHLLYKFSSRAQKGLKFNDQSTINSSFKNLKLLYKFSGILVIVIMALYAVGIVIGIAVAASSV
jgi:phosphotransferase system  glucose/maltose/N-acetylglucosamine-specific IIC component